MGRKRKDGQKPSKMYFTEATENAIIRYNASTDSDEREAIFRDEIAFPLDKMAENVINTFKFPYISQHFDDIKRQVVSFLVVNLERYSPDRGKAFSYFSVIAKRYLILNNTNAYRQEKRSVSFTDSDTSHVAIEEMVTLEAPNARANDDTREFVEIMIAYWDTHLHQIFKKKRDIDIARAVIELFRRVDGIENFNKKSLYLMIREMADCDTGDITKVVNIMKSHTERQLKEFYTHGTLEEEDTFFDG